MGQGTSSPLAHKNSKWIFVIILVVFVAGIVSYLRTGQIEMNNSNKKALTDEIYKLLIVPYTLDSSKIFNERRKFFTDAGWNDYLLFLKNKDIFLRSGQNMNGHSIKFKNFYRRWNGSIDVDVQAHVSIHTDDIAEGALSNLVLMVDVQDNSEVPFLIESWSVKKVIPKNLDDIWKESRQDQRKTKKKTEHIINLE